MYGHNLKLCMSQSGFSVKNCNLHMFYYCLSQSIKFVSYTECNLTFLENICLSNILREKFKIK